MKMEDLLIMEVPVKQLQHVCTAFELKPGGNSSSDYAKAIVSNEGTRSHARHLIDEFHFAGQTAVRLYKPLNLEGEQFKSIGYFRAFLRKKYGEIIFGDGLRIPPTEMPQIFKATEYRNKLYLSMICLGQEKRFFRNYQIVKERLQIVDYIVLHFNPFMLEIRVPVNRDRIYKKAFSNIIDAREEIEWLNLTNLSESETNLLINCELRGILKCAKHKVTEGAFDTIEVRAKPDVNLTDEPEYNEAYSDYPYRIKRVTFAFQNSNGFTEEISTQITTEGINFYSIVSEEVIQHVLDCVLRIKGETLEETAVTSEGEIVNHNVREG